jgi:acetyl-CoA carboxylase biotin carboxyl carrier protein
MDRSHGTQDPGKGTHGAAWHADVSKQRHSARRMGGEAQSGECPGHNLILYKFSTRSLRMPNINIESEITGTVWKVETEIGQVVAQDDLILIVESMKMEIPVTAPARGRIVDIKVAEGDMVTDQQLLVVLES